jgi:hypothetical protein
MSRARKHVTARALGECPEPGENERIMRVVAPRGSNLIEVGSLLDFSCIYFCRGEQGECGQVETPIMSCHFLSSIGLEHRQASTLFFPCRSTLACFIVSVQTFSSIPVSCPLKKKDEVMIGGRRFL